MARVMNPASRISFPFIVKADGTSNHSSEQLRQITFILYDAINDNMDMTESRR